jgi:hypothetical protein
MPLLILCPEDLSKYKPNVLHVLKYLAVLVQYLQDQQFGHDQFVLQGKPAENYCCWDREHTDLRYKLKCKYLELNQQKQQHDLS